MKKMKNKYPWWKWPKNIKPNYTPWYIVLWRIPWMIMFLFLILLACIPIFFAYGPYETTRFWKDAI